MQPKATARLKVQRWGNSLAVRIPATIAKSAGLQSGQPVQVSAQDATITVVAAGEPKLNLRQKLSLFDPEIHAGEAMPVVRVGREAI